MLGAGTRTTSCPSAENATEREGLGDNKGWGGGRGACHFNWGDQRSFCEEVTFDQRPEESEGVSPVDVWGKSIPGRRTARISVA